MYLDHIQHIFIAMKAFIERNDTNNSLLMKQCYQGYCFSSHLEEKKNSAQHFMKNLCYEDASTLQTARKRCDSSSSSFSGPSKRKITKLKSGLA